MSYTQTSEFVSVGHPDRLADQISAKLINEIYKKDGKSAHAAIEVFIVGGETSRPVIHIGGEATTTIDLGSAQSQEWIRDAVRICGYTKQNQEKFGAHNVLSADDYDILVSVNKQSPDIAKGVGFDKGFNDQGIYFGYADNSNSYKLGLAYAVSKYIGEKLFEQANKSKNYGPDIKTLVSIKYKNAATPLYISDITIAIPHTADTKIADVRADIKNTVLEFLATSEFAKFIDPKKSIKWTIDGTGKYVRHGSLGDSGLTGRKIIASGGGSGGYAPHGGGSAVKPHCASDKLLPLFARFIAKIVIDAGLANTCTVSLSGAIGQKRLQSLRVQGDGLNAANAGKVAKFINLNFPEISPKTLNELFRTFELNNFDDVIFDCLTGGDPIKMPWEDTRDFAQNLKKIL